MHSLEIVKPRERPRSGLCSDWRLLLQTFDGVNVTLFLIVRERSPCKNIGARVSYKERQLKESTTAASRLIGERLGDRARTNHSFRWIGFLHFFPVPPR